MIRVQIDLNARCGFEGRMTFTGYTDVEGPLLPTPGVSVMAIDAKSNLAAPAIIIHVNKAAALIYMAVAWAEMKDMSFYSEETHDGSH